MQNHSVYIHIPFCRQRCTYCDFNTYAGQDSFIPDYIEAVCLEIDYLARSLSVQTSQRLPVHTIYIGGGTPSLLSPLYIKKILEKLINSFDIASGAEISLEANPGTVTLPTLLSLRTCGINRLSIGVQSTNPDELRLLGRIHDEQEVYQAISEARRAGFEAISLDLIFGLPNQSLQSWQRSLNQVLPLQPEHISLYALTLEAGTPLQKIINRGVLPPPDPDLAAEMYEWASEHLEQTGYQQYEISNWAKNTQPEKDYRCYHNLQYWHGLPYIGIGAGAHGYTHVIRTENVLTPKTYIHRWRQNSPNSLCRTFPRTPATSRIHKIDRTTEMSETMFMGLRLTQQGISAADFYQRFGQSLLEVYSQPINRLIERGLLEWAAGDILRLTQRGRLLGNQAFIEFV